MNSYRFSVYVIRDGEGWAAVCPEFPDCRARGATYEAALTSLRDLIQIFVEDGLGDDEPPPQPKELRFTRELFASRSSTGTPDLPIEPASPENSFCRVPGGIRGTRYEIQRFRSCPRIPRLVLSANLGGTCGVVNPAGKR